MATSKTVKRYANRKLYDTNKSCYVTLDEIAHMIRTGDEVRVVDNKSGEDLTTITLAQIIFETEKKSAFMPISLLRDLIREGGDALNEMARDSMDVVQERAQAVKSVVSRVISPRGEVDGEAGCPTLLADLAQAPRRALDALQARLEGESAPDAGNLGDDIGEIRARLAALEARLASLAG